MKRLFDLIVATFGLLASLPVLAPVCGLIWLQDFHSPFYVAPRVGRGGRLFRMIKLRSMVVRADKTGVDSTAKADPRITPIGRFVRKCKLDEAPQLWNVVRGEMSLVGPRPNVERETRLYTAVEQRLLSVRPGITDFASIVFSDEGDILEGKPDPDIAYNQLIRPWKSRLGLSYIERRNLWVDVRLIGLTILAGLSRRSALEGVAGILAKRGAPAELVKVARREEPLVPTPPPGATEIVTSRG
jgi:lipopolysaccharide/colanic/teichoic acid biosynthesis glycosyltransferase